MEQLREPKPFDFSLQAFYLESISLEKEHFFHLDASSV